MKLGSLILLMKLKKLLKNNDKVKLHFDMVQALGKLPIDLNDVDLASFFGT